ncbi:MAG: hypothetical protein R3312_07405 [Gammaproteobacteria bacterium]|nr:hypothetical protein [Gammaproteobacteria bacterium]
MSSAIAEDAYMDAINAEAEGLAVDPGTQSDNQRTQVPGGSFTGGWDSDGQSLGEDGLERGLDQADFEDALEEGYYGSYIFYKNLNTVKQNKVYKAYEQGADIDGLRELIIQLKKL